MSGKSPVINKESHGQHGRKDKRKLPNLAMNLAGPQWRLECKCLSGSKFRCLHRLRPDLPVPETTERKHSRSDWLLAGSAVILPRRRD